MMENKPDLNGNNFLSISFFVFTHKRTKRNILFSTFWWAKALFIFFCVKRKRTKRKHGFYRGIFFCKPFLTTLTPQYQKKPQTKKWRYAGFPLICLSILALKAYPAFSGIMSASRSHQQAGVSCEWTNAWKFMKGACRLLRMQNYFHRISCI